MLTVGNQEVGSAIPFITNSLRKGFIVTKRVRNDTKLSYPFIPIHPFHGTILVIFSLSFIFMSLTPVDP